MRRVNAIVDAKVIEPGDTGSDSPLGKAYVQVKCTDANGEEVVVNFTLNVLGMLGGMAKGTAARFGYKWE